MRYNFQFSLLVAGVAVGTINGAAVIGPNYDSVSISKSGRYHDWTVLGLHLCSVGDPEHQAPGEGFVALPDDHWLHDRLLVDLLNRCRRAIDNAWELDCEANSNRRVRLAAAS